MVCIKNKNKDIVSCDAIVLHYHVLLIYTYLNVNSDINTFVKLIDKLLKKFTIK